MPEQLFSMKTKNLLQLRQFYKKEGPRQFNRAAAMTLNSFAFGTSRISRKVIKNRMTVRNERFVDSSIRTKKTSTFIPINSQVAVSGSIVRDRFTGWKEQEEGTRTDRTRTASPFARGGGKKQIPVASRLKPGNKFLAPRDFKGNDNEHRVIVMLQTLERQNFKKPFIIKGHRRFTSGLYKRRGKKIMLLWKFKTRKQPKRIKWQSLARSIYFRTTSIDGVWAESLRRVLKFK